MRPVCYLRPALAVLTMSLGFACTPSSNAGRGPTTGADSAADPARDPQTPTRGTSSVTGSDDLAAGPPRREAEPEETAAPPVTRPVTPQATRPLVVPGPVSPYRVRVVDDSHRELPTFAKAGRRYVMGTAGARYSIEVSNPTSRRVEAVISVDGLDAVDGQPANYVTKRGYILPAYGNMTVDGFRTSYDEVATFRFSSVANSYAGRLGQARDVGVIGVAFFAERQPVAEFDRPSHSHDEPSPAPRPEDRRSAPRPRSAAAESSPAPRSPAPGGDGYGRSAGGEGGGGAATRSDPSPAPSPAEKSARQDDDERRGLGTEFGEARESPIGTTTFERLNPGTPSELVAFRYNDRRGLAAIGIAIPPAPRYPDPDLRLRESSEPFRENRFAQAPP